MLMVGDIVLENNIVVYSVLIVYNGNGLPDISLVSGSTTHNYERSLFCIESLQCTYTAAAATTKHNYMHINCKYYMICACRNVYRSNYKLSHYIFISNLFFVTVHVICVDLLPIALMFWNHACV